MTEPDEQHARGLAALGSAAAALEAAEVEHWFFGGWAVDLWVGRVTRAHDDIDVLVWRRDEKRVDDALSAVGWSHRPTPEDVVGTSYLRDDQELQLTYAVPGEEGGVVVPVPDQPIVLSAGALPFARRELGDVSARVLTLEMMLASKESPRTDEAGGAKDHADLEALREVAS